ncbi:MAG TPA: alpha/beta hydrolase [Marmoricola sp.]|nr:alpha/beta hydrolase [Marmoricola sp.]
MNRTYDALDAPVSGGLLRAGRWTSSATTSPPPSSGPLVLALHGVTANHLAWGRVAELTSYDVVAPDLRGRGRSSSLQGPAGMAAHAADLAALLDHLEVERALVVGHSMGGFVATAFHEAHPDRVSDVVLVDGGLPLPPMPEGMSTDDAIAAIIGPAAERLSMTFADAEAYFDFWKQHPALGPWWSREVEAYFAYDLVGQPPHCRSSVSLAAVREDSADLLDGSLVADRAAALPAGTVFLRAVNGMMDEPGGLYPSALVEQHAASYPGLDLRDVDGVNHYTLVMGSGAQAVADTVAAVATRGSR